MTRLTPLAEADIAAVQDDYGIWYRVEPDESVVVACLAHRRDLSMARGRTVKPVEPS